MADLPPTADVVVIGGGVVGTSVAYHLARAGCTDVVLIERDTLGSGSTSKAPGGIRAQFSDELNIRMALENIRRFGAFADELGAEIDFRQWGYLFLLTEPHVESFTAGIHLQHTLGVPSELLEPEEVLRLVPQLGLDGVVAAAFCPIDGQATPEAVTQGYAVAARRLGATIVQGCEVTSIDVSGDQVTGVATARGAVAAPTVVCAAGVWSPELTSPIGVDIPVVAEKRHVWLTNGADPLPRTFPLTIDFDTGFYIQREGDHILFGGRAQSLEDLAPAATRRLPLLDSLPIRPGWWGYYEMSPDHNAIVGRATSPDGLLYATGFSGHGFQQAPVVGDYLAHLIVEQQFALDLSPLALERFTHDALRPEGHVI